MSKFVLIIADFNKNNCLLTSMKQLPLEFFKSVAFFSGTPGSIKSSIHLGKIGIKERVCF